MTLPDPYYADDHVTIFHADCLDLIAELEFDVVVTDPPYGIGWTRGLHKAKSSKAHGGIVNDEDTFVRDQALATTAPAPAAVFGSFAAPPPAGVKQTLVWQKPADAGVVGSVCGFRRDVEPVYVIGDWPRRSPQWSAVLRSSRNGISAVATETGHPHTKPVDLMRMMVEAIGPGVVLDPFMGSGSTLVAAKDLGRKAIGVEVSEEYCEVAALRCGQEVLDFGGAA